jgi:hypothetical protein
MNNEKLRNELEVLKRIDAKNSQNENILQYLSIKMLKRLAKLKQSKETRLISELVAEIEKEVLYFKEHGKYMEYENE